MRYRVVAAALVALSVLGAAAASAKKAPKPQACPGGRFPVSGGPLVPGGKADDAIVVDDRQVSVESGCAAVTAKRKTTRKTTRLVATFRACTGIKGRARLTVVLDAATCETVKARFQARRAKINRKIATQVETPPDAGGRVSDGLPEGAVLVTQEQWDALKQRPDVHSTGPQRTADDDAARAALAADDEQVVTEFLQGHPSFAGQYLGGVDPTNPSLASADDGNYALTVMDTTGAPQVFTTHGRRWFRETVAGQIRVFPTRDNQLHLYDDYYAGLNAIDPALVGQIPSPANARALELSTLRTLNDGLAASIGQYIALAPPPPGGTPPPGYPAHCSDEEHAGDGTDEGGETSCGTHTSGGVYANKNWPLKFFATCTKNQARRGTCWSFATAGATELTIAKKYHRWVNLAEQDLIYEHHTLWYPHLYGDGGWPGAALEQILARGYFFPWESQWDYNGSKSRTANDMTATYRNSCVGYDGAERDFCSDTAGQGQIACVNLLLFFFCLQVPPNYGGTSSGFQPTAYSELWDAGNINLSFGKMLWAIAIFQKPVIYGFAVAPSFYPDANGYVRYNGPHCPVDSAGMCTTAPGCECDGGGHAVLITGLIDNAQLPAGAPAGSGGGYFIIKNSWSHCYGDAGYAYLPYDWVKAYGLSAVVLGDVN